MGCEEKIRERFAMMIDRGQTPDFYFIILQLVGPSLQIIRDNIIRSEFSPSTTFKIALESLESIRILHSETGYIHRDIKPGNFTVGNRKNYTKIIMIDFGIARKLLTKDNVLRLPRKEVKFLGTVRFASRKCHRHEEQGRQGDIESWLYMICDCFNQDLVFALKNDLRENDGNHKCFSGQLPKEFRDIMLYNDKLGYEDIPDYELLKSFIEQAANRMKIDLTQEYEWERLGPIPGHDTDDET
uniref:non-specific serine/threonine protein kinase n=1 Tax=Panagrolaimus davidi TaxID=227884 RepID=A0A914Q0G6_9BILA